MQESGLTMNCFRCLLIAALVVPAALGIQVNHDDEQTADEKLLQEHGLKTDGPGLLTFLQERSFSREERAQLMAPLIRQLGSAEFEKREAASRKLVAHSRQSIPFLKAALKDPDPERARRARVCLADIGEGVGHGLFAAVVRQLARKNPDGTVEMLLRYLAVGDEEADEEASLNALRTVGLRDGKAADAIVAALRDSETPRRAAAAYVVAASRDKRQRQAVVALLQRDEVSLVRFRMAQGMLAARDPQGVPFLIDVLRDGSASLAWRVEDLLSRLAGENGPSTSLNSDDDRKKAHAAWSAWWKVSEPTVDLARLDAPPPFLNRTLVCVTLGSFNNRLSEIGPDGRVRWEMRGITRPSDAQVLPGGRVLITEDGKRLCERDLGTDKILWSYEIQDPLLAYPRCVRRLPDGSTFIASDTCCCEIDAAGKKIFAFKFHDLCNVNGGIDRRANGNVVILTREGVVSEFNRDGKLVRVFNLPSPGGAVDWKGVKAVSCNRYLCVEHHSGSVVEYDADGKEQWKCVVRGANYAEPLPNGQTMICSFSGQRIVHVDREGKVVWEAKVFGQPGRAHVR